MAVPAGSPASSGILLDPSAPRFTTHDPAELLAHFYYVVNSAAAVNYCCSAWHHMSKSTSEGREQWRDLPGLCTTSVRLFHSDL